MTREEAISLLRRYRRDVYHCNPKYISFAKKNAYFTTCVYGRFLIEELIRKLMYTDRDPIAIISDVYSWLDEILGGSDDDRFITHEFAAIVEYEVGNILRYLQQKEKEKNEDANH